MHHGSIRTIGVLGMSKRNVEDIIKNAEDTLQTAAFGLDDFRALKGPKKFAGLRNFVVFGRSVTLVIQTLSNTVDDFEEWYAPIREEMSQDKSMRYFLELRNVLLKEGTLRTQVQVNLHMTPEKMKSLGPPPKGATSMFIGDPYGGSGWLIPMPDGTMEKYYVDFPSDLAQVTDLFAAVPEKFKEAIDGKDIASLGSEYLTKLSQIVDKCRKKYLGAPASIYGPDKKRLPPYMRIIK